MTRIIFGKRCCITFGLQCNNDLKTLPLNSRHRSNCWNALLSNSDLGSYWPLECQCSPKTTPFKSCSSYNVMNGASLVAPWRRVLQKLIVAHLVRKYPVSCGTRRFISVSTRARHWGPSWNKSSHLCVCLPSTRVSPNYACVSHLCVCLPSTRVSPKRVLFFRLSDQILYVFVSLPCCVLRHNELLSTFVVIF
jgi:hypothetical protein